MGEGLIGLIIFIVVINIIGRILKSVTSAARTGAQQARPKQAAPRPTRERELLRELLELEAERTQQAFEEGKTVEAADVPETELPEKSAAFEERRTPAEGVPWREERFEVSIPPSDAYTYRAPVGFAVAPDKLTAAQSVPTGVVPRRRRRLFVSDGLRGMLGCAHSLRTAVLLSEILGPCRAKRRHR